LLVEAMVPTRLSFITCNLWRTDKWPARAPALERLVTLFNPDVLCVQELQPATQAFLDRTLNGHARIHDAFPGWTNEGNLWWSKALFDLRDFGAAEVEQLEPERRLFWARLALRSATARSVLVATAHLTAPKRSEEPETGVSPRVRELKAICAELERLVGPGEPAFFMGDMNDAWHPQHALKKIGFVSCFAALGLQSPPTFHCYPTAGTEPGEPTLTEAIDLIAANRHARAIAASVPQVFAAEHAPSDHWPVHAVYQID
jgi:endonuclease/exonuclease/phosphatase family metal-dependent hydrolase